MAAAMSPSEGISLTRPITETTTATTASAAASRPGSDGALSCDGVFSVIAVLP